MDADSSLSISSIVNTLEVGAITSNQPTASVAIKEAYNNLKTLIQLKLEKYPDAKLILRKYEENPEVWEKPLTYQLEQARVDEDRKIVAAAQLLMALVNPQQQLAYEQLDIARQDVERDLRVARKQANIRFLVAFTLLMLGGLLTLSGIIVLLLTNNATLGLLSSISGILLNAVGVLTFRAVRKIQARLHKRFSNLLVLQNYIYAITLASKTDDPALKEAITRRILDTTARVSEENEELHLTG